MARRSKTLVERLQEQEPSKNGRKRVRDEGTGEPDSEADATAADLIRMSATIEWVWPKWLQKGVLNCLASNPGEGKTRLCCDLARRVYHGLCWPDGSPATLPKGSTTLWVASDNQHAELGTLPTVFGF